MGNYQGAQQGMGGGGNAPPNQMAHYTQTGTGGGPGDMANLWRNGDAGAFNGSMFNQQQQPNVTNLVQNAGAMQRGIGSALTAPQGGGTNITDLVRMAGMNQKQQGSALSGMQGQGVGQGAAGPAQMGPQYTSRPYGSPGLWGLGSSNIGGNGNGK